MSLVNTTAIEFRYELAVDITTASRAATTRPTSPTGISRITTVGSAWSAPRPGNRSSATRPRLAVTKKNANANTPESMKPIRACRLSGVENVRWAYGGTSVSPSRKARKTPANAGIVQVPRKLVCRSGMLETSSAGPPALATPITSASGRKTPRKTNCSMSVWITAQAPPNVE